MDRDTLIAAIREQELELRKRGVTYAALFGSRARNDGRPDSDLDLAIDIDPQVQVTIYDLVGIGHLISDTLQIAVDVVERASMRPAFRARVEPELVRVF